MHPEQNRRREQTNGESRYRPEDTGRLDYQQSGQNRTEPDFREDHDYSGMDGNRGGDSSSQSNRHNWSDSSRRGMGDREYQGGNSWDRNDRNSNDRGSNNYDQQRTGSQQDRDWERARSAPQDFTGRSQQGSWDRTSSMGSAGYRQSGLGSSQKWGPQNSGYGSQDAGYGARNNEDWESSIRGGRSSYNSGVDSVWSGGGQSFREGNRGSEQQGTHRGKGPKGYQRSDERIHEDVSEQLTQHSEIDASNIEVKVQQGEVTLTGTTSDRNAKRMAEDIAEAVSGVKEVTNQIRVSQSHSSPNGQGQKTDHETSGSSSSSHGNRKGEHETASAKK